jgi:SAM-dependent methyltransferase
MDEESYFSRQRMYGEKFLSIVQTSLSDCKVVFELGCGSGGALAVFMENGYQVAGCDYDRRLLEFGSAKGVTNLHYGSLKELQIALPDVKADFIFMNHVFEHASNPETLLVECKKALTSNGRIVISVPDILNVDKFDFFKGDVLPMLHIAHKYNYSFQGLHELAKRLGLWAQLIYPSDSIKTHTSIMPELWVEMKESNGTENENMEFVTNTLDRILFLEQVYQSNLIISRQPSPRSVESSLFERLAKILGFK